MSKSKIKAPSVRSDVGTDERHQHGEVVLEPSVVHGPPRARETVPSALDWYWKHGHLADDDRENDRRYYAGDQFRGDWETAGLEPRTTGGYDVKISGNGSIESLTGKRLSAYRRWQDAVQAVGPIAAPEVIAVCCSGQRVGRRRIEILCRGLDRLADHQRKRKFA